MKILMISSEALPYSKTGGLGDVISSLSLALAELKVEIKLFIPCTEKNSKENFPTVLTLSENKFLQSSQIQILKAPNKNLEIYLVKEKRYITRKGVYGKPKASTPYPDNSSRFALFSQSVLNAVIAMKWQPNIIHTHDWQTALINSYVKLAPWQEYFKNSKTIFSIHNLGYQGEFPIREIHSVQLPSNKINKSPKNSKLINLMINGLLDADIITTVSPTYANEILKLENSQGLSYFLKKRSKNLLGLLNGIDLKKWNPKTDTLIAQNFDEKDLSGKKECKKAILKEFGLNDNEKPLISMITRLANQKGIKELFDPQTGAIRKICKELNLNFILIGTGEFWCEEEIKKLNKELQNFSARLTFNESLSHQVEAGSDFFLMPSQYEPCGLNQMYSSRYGTLPIVRHTGGLADTVIPYTGKEEDATGYSFYDLTPDAIFGTVKWAIEGMKNRPQIHNRMIINGMKKDFSWKASAKSYLELYKKILK